VTRDRFEIENRYSPEVRRTLIALGQLSGSDREKLIRMIMLFSAAPDDVKDCAEVIVQQLHHRVPGGRDSLVEGIDEIIDYIEFSRTLSRSSDESSP
jgi:hypothetical protein